MTGMRALRSLMLAIVALAGVAAMLLSGPLGFGYRRATVEKDPLGATLVAASARGPLRVDSLRSGGEAEHAGLRLGDSIDAVNGRPARSTTEIAQALTKHNLAVLHVRRAGHASSGR